MLNYCRIAVQCINTEYWVIFGHVDVDKTSQPFLLWLSMLISQDGKLATVKKMFSRIDF